MQIKLDYSSITSKIGEMENLKTQLTSILDDNSTLDLQSSKGTASDKVNSIIASLKDTISNQSDMMAAVISYFKYYQEQIKKADDTAIK